MILRFGFRLHVRRVGQTAGAVHGLVLADRSRVRRVVLDGALPLLDAVLDGCRSHPGQIEHGHGGASIAGRGAGHRALLADHPLGVVLNGVEAGEDLSRAGLDLSLLDILQPSRDSKEEEKWQKLHFASSAPLSTGKIVGRF